MSDRGTETPTRTAASAVRRLWQLRVMFALVFVAAAAVVWITNRALTERFTETTRNRAELRLALYAGSLSSELQRISIVPRLLARDPELITALETGDYSETTRRLIGFVDEIGAGGLMLLDREGRAVAATDRNRLGSVHRQEPFFVEAQRSTDTVFTLTQTESGAFGFVYSRRIESQGDLAGIIVVEVDLVRLERSWGRPNEVVVVSDSTGTIILTTEPSWRGLDEVSAQELQPPPTSIERAIRATQDWAAAPPDNYVLGEAVMRVETRVGFQGWRVVTFETYASVRERVNGVLALEVMGFAILLAFLSWVMSRRSESRLIFFQRESAELRQLNQALQREIAERERAEKSLEVAEQTVAQTSKLAVLGEMSAAVSHELNQPLAAMKTYLAGARLLLQRRRPEEALSSFQRIDGLIERMGAITRQLKSYARKGEEAFAPMDARDAVSTALEMMEPQLKRRQIDIRRTMPPEPVMILGDRLRLEQVIVNLLRNALDATKSVRRPQIEITLSQGEAARLIVRDNGEGIEDFDALFEPFYTTKSPGDGVGLGLAISSGIINDLGGRLTARSGESGGAVFEVRLPLLRADGSAPRAAE